MRKYIAIVEEVVSYEIPVEAEDLQAAHVAALQAFTDGEAADYLRGIEDRFVVQVKVNNDA